MKKSLNNRFKGKRLVEGDENEITAHELLLKEENNKIVVKGRDESGNVKVLSGEGESIVNNLYYYITHSGLTMPEQEYSIITSFKDFLNREISRPEGESLVQLEAVLPAANSSNVNVSYKESGDNEYVEITVKLPTDELVSPIPLYYNLYKYYNNGQYTPIAASSTMNHDTARPILYNAATNVLIYYTTVSNCYVSITPKSLAKTLKCYCSILSNHLYLPEGATVEYIK